MRDIKEIIHLLEERKLAGHNLLKAECEVQKWCEEHNLDTTDLERDYGCMIWLDPDNYEELYLKRISSALDMEADSPEYLKLYTKTGVDFHKIPNAYQKLFLELAERMGRGISQNFDDSQTVYTGKPISDEIQRIIGWKANMYQKGLKLLCDIGAIKKVNRNVYQVNPQYAFNKSLGKMTEDIVYEDEEGNKFVKGNVGGGYTINVCPVKTGKWGYCLENEKDIVARCRYTGKLWWKE